MNKTKSNMLYTPKLKIPLGEIILKQNGSHVLKIKKPNKPVTVCQAFLEKIEKKFCSTKVHNNKADKKGNFFGLLLIYEEHCEISNKPPSLLHNKYAGIC